MTNSIILKHMHLQNAAVIVEAGDSIYVEANENAVHLVEWNGHRLLFGKTFSSIEEAQIAKDLDGKKGPVFDSEWCKTWDKPLYAEAIEVVQRYYLFNE